MFTNGITLTADERNLVAHAMCAYLDDAEKHCTMLERKHGPQPSYKAQIATIDAIYMSKFEPRAKD